MELVEHAMSDAHKVTCKARHQLHTRSNLEDCTEIFDLDDSATLVFNPIGGLPSTNGTQTQREVGVVGEDWRAGVCICVWREFR